MSELNKPKKSFKSIIAHPIKVEMQPIEHKSDRVLTVDELAVQIDEARKGTAKVDSQYVGFVLDERGHLFDYKLNYIEFLDSMKHILLTARERKANKPADVYKNSHKMIIQ